MHGKISACCSADALQYQMRVRDAQEVLAQVRLHFIETGMRERQVLLLRADEPTTVARKEISLCSRLVRCIAAIVGNHAPAWFQSCIAEAKQVARFRIVEMMHKAEGKDDVESAVLLNRVMAYPLAHKLATIAIPSSRRRNVRRVCIDTEVPALGKKWQHVPWAASDVQNVITRLWPNVLIYDHPAAVVGADQKMKALVKEGAIENWSDELDHMRHRLELSLSKIAYWPPRSTLTNKSSSRIAR